MKQVEGSWKISVTQGSKAVSTRPCVQAILVRRYNLGSYKAEEMGKWTAGSVQQREGAERLGWVLGLEWGVIRKFDGNGRAKNPQFILGNAARGGAYILHCIMGTNSAFALGPRKTTPETWQRMYCVTIKLEPYSKHADQSGDVGYTNNRCLL
jgi:hypothetical protein